MKRRTLSRTSSSVAFDSPPSVSLGEIIEAALGEAASLCADPRRAAALAADAVTRILLVSGRRGLVESLAAN